MSKQIIIKACPYSGAKHTVKLLNGIGLEVGHEIMRKDGTVSWRHTHLRKEDFDTDVVMLQQVRHPLMTISQLKSITSGYKHPRTMENIWKMFTDRTKKMDVPWDIDKVRCGLIGAMNLWYWWNKFGALTADGMYTIESLPDRWEWFLGMIGHEFVPMPAVSKIINRHTTPKILSWDDLYETDPELTARILELATHFGYEQTPYQYLDDPYYQFPEKIELSTCGREVDIFRYAERQERIDAGA